MAFSLLSFLTAATTASSETGNVPTSVAEWESLWTEVLAANVDDAGRVDFTALVDDHSDLERVVAFIASVDPQSRPELFPSRNDRLAYYINAYNALAMFGVIKKRVPKNLDGLRKVTFFFLQRFKVGGRSISLYNLENKVIRPIGEERIHFALNCMVVGCPRLPQTAFTSAKLEEQLDGATRLFISEDRNVQIDLGKSELRLSSIFDFYTEDFLDKAPNLTAYVKRYRTEEIPANYKVRFIDYDWTVNVRKRAGG